MNHIIKLKVSKLSQNRRPKRDFSQKKKKKSKLKTWFIWSIGG